MKAELVPENGDPPIPIARDLVVIGRRNYCDIVIDHPGLSKRHCVLVKTDGLLVIRDLISTNGTKVKGQRVRWAALLPDDRIALGNYKLRVYLGADHLPAPSDLYQARTARATVGARPAELGGSGRPPMSMAPPPANGGLDIELSSSEEEILPASAARFADSDPLLPIVLDEEDEEIIDLD